MRPYEIGMDREPVQFVDQLAAFSVWHADDGFGVIPQEEALASGLRMRTHDRMVDRRHSFLLLFGHRLFAVASGPGKVQVVHRTPVGYASLPGRIEPVIRTIHVGEMRLAAGLRNDFAVDYRRVASGASPRTVGVPFQRALIGMTTIGLAMLIKV